jgi:DNA-binding PadR family transcriptional regulator
MHVIVDNLKCVVDEKTSEHILHLYSSKVDKDLIHRSFLVSMGSGEDAIIVSSDDSGKIRKELDFIDDRLKVLRFDEMKNLEAEVNKHAELRLIIDAGSLPSQTYEQIREREQDLIGFAAKKPLRCLCTYRVNGLSEQAIRPLSKLHSLLQLTTSDLTLISGEFMESLQVSIDSIKKNVKDNLGVIVLALIRGKAMTGLDIMKTIHMEFDVLLSPGAVYPLLDSLQRRGLLSSLRVGKERVYETTIESKTEIQQLIHDQIHARKLLNNYLQSKSNLFTETDQLGDNATQPTLRPRIRGPWLD